MKDNYESTTFGSHGIPPEDCSDGEVWQYAISFKGYSWTLDMHKEGKLEPILSEESIEFLDKNGGNWRDATEGMAVMLASCVGSGRDINEASIEELRTALFMEQRSNHWTNDDSSYDYTEYARGLIEEIRKKS
jgi:hypothetical protein